MYYMHKNKSQKRPEAKIHIWGYNIITNMLFAFPRYMNLGTRKAQKTNLRDLVVGFFTLSKQKSHLSTCTFEYFIKI